MGECEYRSGNGLFCHQAQRRESYEEMKAEDMVVADLNNQAIEGELNPSSDTPTHAVLYKHFPGNWRDLSYAFDGQRFRSTSGYRSTRHGYDSCRYFYGAFLVARFYHKKKSMPGYEHETGNVIIETFQK